MKITLVAAAVSALVLAGCVRSYTREVAVTSPPPAPAQPTVVQPTIVVDMAPPPPQSESIPAPPYSGAVWMSGYWSWSNGQYTWVPGHFEQPRSGYVWVPQRWEQVGGRWQLTGGTWVRQ